MKRHELEKVLSRALGDHLRGEPLWRDVESVVEREKGELRTMMTLMETALLLCEQRVQRGGAPLDEGFAWLGHVAARVIQAMHSLQSPQVDAYFGHACRDKLLEIIPKSRKTLDICVYTITDNAVVKAIMKAKRTRVKVRIVTDLEKVDALGSDIRYLEKNGVFVKVNSGEAFMHHKFAIFDRASLITGSFNWTMGAATANSENFIFTDSAQAVEAFQQEFDKLWEGCTWL